MDFPMSQVVREAYSARAEQYIDLFGTRERVHEDDLAFIGRHLSRGSGPILDVGCGPGRRALTVVWTRSRMRHFTRYLHSLGAATTCRRDNSRACGHSVAVTFSPRPRQWPIRAY
jgi:hypothetical protein